MFHYDVINCSTSHRMQSEWRIQIHNGCGVAPEIIIAIIWNQRHLRSNSIIAQDIVIRIRFQALNEVEGACTYDLQVHEIQLFAQVTNCFLFYFAYRNINETALVNVPAHLHKCNLHFFESSYQASQLVEWLFFICNLLSSFFRDLWHFERDILGS